MSRKEEPEEGAEDEVVEPEYLGELFDILDKNMKHAKQNPTPAGRKWIADYRALRKQYDGVEENMLAQIAEFNMITSDMEKGLITLSKEFSKIGPSPGEFEEVDTMISELHELAESPDLPKVLEAKITKLQGELAKKKRAKLIHLGQVIRLQDKLEVIKAVL